MAKFPASAMAILAAALPLGAIGCARTPANEPAAKAAASTPARQVSASRVRERVWPATIRVQGTLESHEQSVIGTKLAGRVSAIEIDLGSRVSRGDLLAALDGRELELRVRQNEALLAQACAAVGIRPEDSETEMRRETAPPVLVERALLDAARDALARGERLEASRAISADAIERLKTDLRAAEARYQSSLNDVGEKIAIIGVRRAELAVMRQQLEEMRLVAPFDGVVQARHAAPGEYLQPGDPVATVVRADSLRFTAGVPERSAGPVRVGQELRIHLEGESKPVVVSVSRISPTVDASGRFLRIEADVPNLDYRLRAGLFAEGEVVVASESTTLALPASAVEQFAGIDKVWVIRDGAARERPVRIGRRRAAEVEILEGLAAGDLVVTNNEEGAADVVAIREEPAAAEGSAVDSSSPGDIGVAE